MRKLVWIAAGFGTAAFLSEYVLPIPGLPYIAAALAVCALVFLPRKCRRPRAALLLFSAAAGMLYWWGWYALRVAPCEALAGQDIVLTARVTDWPSEQERYSRLSVTITEGAPKVPAYLYLYGGELPEMSPGDVITCTVRVRSAMLRGEKRAHTATSAGRCLVGYFKEEPRVVSERTPLRYLPRHLARYVSRTCEELFPGRTGVFMKALLTGDKDDLYDDPVLYGDMRGAGVLHAVAVSGMHVFILVTMLQLLLGRGRRTSLLSLPLMAVFVLMSGAGSSVIRAAVMQTLWIGAPVVNRESDEPTSLAAAMLFLLLLNPMSVGGIGLQLSFACMLGFSVLLPGLSAEIGRLRRRHMRRLPRRLRGLILLILADLAASFAATAFSVPVAALYFGTVPLLSPLANLLALPVAELMFGLGYLVCAVNAILPAAAGWAASVLAWGVRYCLAVFHGIASLPFACLYTADKAVVVWLILVYALALGWVALRRRGVDLKPVIVCLAAVIGLQCIFLRQEASLRFGRRELAVLDVGHGACSVLLDRDSSAVVDCGGSGLTDPGDAAADWLYAAGVRHVDVLVLTHLDDDHINGVETLLCRMPVGLVVLPAEAEEDGAERIRLLAETYGAGTLSIDSDTQTRLGDLTLRLYPSAAGSGDNEHGIVVRAEYPGAAAYIMGDAGQKTELWLIGEGAVTDADILVAGHHGSASATGAYFLQLADPETAVVSVGQNSYGQPSEETMERLSRYCDTVYRTDEAGTVVISMRETE